MLSLRSLCSGLIRHFQSLRNLERDYGWIHTLLEDAENERMHLITFMGLLNPGAFFKGAVTVTQGLCGSVLFVCGDPRIHGMLYATGCGFFVRALPAPAGGIPTFRSETFVHIPFLCFALPQSSTCCDKGQRICKALKRWNMVGTG